MLYEVITIMSSFDDTCSDIDVDSFCAGVVKKPTKDEKNDTSPAVEAA